MSLLNLYRAVVALAPSGSFAGRAGQKLNADGSTTKSTPSLPWTVVNLSGFTASLVESEGVSHEAQTITVTVAAGTESGAIALVDNAIAAYRSKRVEANGWSCGAISQLGDARFFDQEPDAPGLGDRIFVGRAQFRFTASRTN